MDFLHLFIFILCGVICCNVLMHCVSYVKHTNTCYIFLSVRHRIAQYEFCSVNDYLDVSGDTTRGLLDGTGMLIIVLCFTK